uniref:Secreted protein n=1 Tax=Panagrellus redivivus TaxID=6233 RepID=A0A7E4UWH4_PANRE
MHLYQVFLNTFFLVIHVAEAVEVGKEVEGGVQLLSVGPVQLILPDILSFTIKNTDTCIGYFEICYVSDPTASRHQL